MASEVDKTAVEPLLEISNLKVAVVNKRVKDVEKWPKVVHGVSLSINRGETLGIVGESGSGKSVTLLSVLGLLGNALDPVEGEIKFQGKNLTNLPSSELRSVRGKKIAMIYQDPMTSLSPFMKVGDQVMEALLVHGVSRQEAEKRTLEMFAKVGIPDPVRTFKAWPHQFSGGMRQRVMIAMALVLKPSLVIADEATTALDVTIQQQILAMFSQLRAEMGMATIWVSHDLGVVAKFAERVAVMYAGTVVEEADTETIYNSPQHPYTKLLLSSLPIPGVTERKELAQIPGRPPLPAPELKGCPFIDRCPEAIAICATSRPELVERNGSRVACWVPSENWSKLSAASKV